MGVTVTIENLSPVDYEVATKWIDSLGGTQVWVGMTRQKYLGWFLDCPYHDLTVTFLKPRDAAIFQLRWGPTLWPF